MLDVKGARQLIASAKDGHTQWQSLYEECARYVAPNRISFYTNAKGQERDQYAYSSEGVSALSRYAARLKSQLFRPDRGWVMFRPVTEGKRELVTKLEQRFYDEIEESNLHQALNECFQDLALGTASLAILEGTGIDTPKIAFRSLPIERTAILEGADGSVGTIVRWHEVKGYTFGATFGVEIPDKEKNRKVRFTEIYQCEMKSGKRKYTHYVLKEGAKEFTTTNESEYPMAIGFRWSTAVNEIYGRGVAVEALTDLRELSYLAYVVSANASLNAIGSYQFNDSSNLSAHTLRVEPGVFNAVPPNADIKAMPRVGNTGEALALIENLKMSVRRQFLDDIRDATQAVPSATQAFNEFAEFNNTTGERIRFLGDELVRPLVQAVCEILLKGNDELKSSDFRIVPTGQFYRAAALQEEMARLQLGASLNETVPLVDLETLARKVWKRSGSDPDVLRSEEEVARIQQERAAMQAAQAEQLTQEVVEGALPTGENGA